MPVPQMIADDLSRRFFLDVCANGSVHIRERGSPGGAANGLLPVFSTDTYEEAQALRVLHCRLARDGSGLYFLNDPPRARVIDAKRREAYEDLGRISELFRAWYRKGGIRPAKATETHLNPRTKRAALDILDRIEKAGS